MTWPCTWLVIVGTSLVGCNCSSTRTPPRKSRPSRIFCWTGRIAHTQSATKTTRNAALIGFLNLDHIFRRREGENPQIVAGSPFRVKPTREDAHRHGY